MRRARGAVPRRAFTMPATLRRLRPPNRRVTLHRRGGTGARGEGWRTRSRQHGHPAGPHLTLVGDAEGDAEPSRRAHRPASSHPSHPRPPPAPDRGPRPRRPEGSRHGAPKPTSSLPFASLNILSWSHDNRRVAPIGSVLCAPGLIVGPVVTCGGGGVRERRVMLPGRAPLLSFLSSLDLLVGRGHRTHPRADVAQRHVHRVGQGTVGAGLPVLAATRVRTGQYSLPSRS